MVYRNVYSGPISRLREENPSRRAELHALSYIYIRSCKSHREGCATINRGNNFLGETAARAADLARLYENVIRATIVTIYDRLVTCKLCEAYTSDVITCVRSTVAGTFHVRVYYPRAEKWIT